MKPTPSRRALLRGAAAASLASAVGLGRARAAGGGVEVPGSRMRDVYEEVSTPYKYGVVLENELGFVDARASSDWAVTGT